MTKRLSVLSGAVAILAAAASAHAQAPADRPSSYDYAHAGLAITSLDHGGFEGGGSFTVARNLHVFASYQDWDLNSNVDRSTLQVGAGYHWDISNNLDLVLALAYADSKLDTPGSGRIDDNGAILSAGLRGWITNAVELSGTILLDDSLDSSDTVIELGGEYHMSDQFSLGGRVRVDEDLTTLFVGGRFYFGGNQR